MVYKTYHSSNMKPNIIAPFPRRTALGQRYIMTSDHYYSVFGVKIMRQLFKSRLRVVNDKLTALHPRGFPKSIC